jgi:hypothetical protein
MLSFVLDEF